MAHKKAGSSSKNGRDSAGTGLGRDYTVFATVKGRVRFEHQTRHKKRIRVEPVIEAAPAAEAEPAVAGA